MHPVWGIWHRMQSACDALAEERERYAGIFSLSACAYLITDRNGAVVEANAAAAKLLQRPARFLVGKPVDVLLKGGLRFDSRAIVDAQDEVTGHCWALR